MKIQHLLFMITLFLHSHLLSCALQEEGERCSVKAGDSDCKDGLVCVSASTLGGESDICCLPSGSTNPDCVSADNGTPADENGGNGGNGGGGSSPVGGNGGSDPS